MQNVRACGITRRGVLHGAAAAASLSSSIATLMLSWTDARAAGATDGALTLWAAKTLSGGAQKIALQAEQTALANAMAKAGIPGPTEVIGALLDQIGLGAPTQRNLLAEIKQQLDVINDTLRVISGQITDLQKQLRTAELRINAHQSEEVVKQHVNALERLFGSSTTGVDRGSLIALVSGGMQGQRSDVSGFRRAVRDKVQIHIDGIADGLTTGFADNSPLLEQWTAIAVAQVPLDAKGSEKAQRDRVAKGYRLLEGYFKQALGAQLKGVLLQAVAAEGSTPQAALRTARANFFRTLDAELRLFRSCVERLVFSTALYADTWIPEPLFTLRRADVFVAGLRAVFNEGAADAQSQFGGVFGHVLVREGDTSPGSREGMLRIGGAEVSATAGDWIETRNIKWASQQPNAYPTVDPSGEKFQVIRTRAPAPRPGFQALPGSPPNSQPPANVKWFVNYPIDLVTLEQGGGPSSVFASAYVDASRTLTGPPRMPAGSLNWPNKVDRSPVNVIDPRVERSPDFLRMGKKNGPVYVNTFTLAFETARMYIETLTLQIAKTPLFTIEDDGKVVLLVTGSLSPGVVPANAPHFNHRVRFFVRGTAGTEVAFYDSGAALDKLDRGPNATAIAPFERLAEIPAKAGERYDLVVEFQSRGNFRDVPERMVLRETFKLECDEVLLFRSQGVGFET